MPLILLVHVWIAIKPIIAYGIAIDQGLMNGSSHPFELSN